MEGGRQTRRFGRRTLLPLHVRRLSHTVSCWYCDYKTSAFNEPLFRVGRRHARLLRVWFSVGIGFSLTAMLGVYVILLWESATLLHLYNGNAWWLSKLLPGSLFGIFPSVFGLSTTVADVGYMCISTIISVSAHEFGHALAAASEGIQIEYIAVFVAVLFPGALVAFNYEVLQALPRFSTLRIYCAGIWHNAACCAVCGLALFLLPLILYPFYIHGEIPMVLDVPSSSPLSGFLSSGDLVMSMDGITIHNPQEWMEVAAHIHEQTLRNSNFSNSFHFTMANGNKGYCVPSSLMEASTDVLLTDDQSTCPNEFTAFTTLSCSNSSMLDDGSIADKYQNSREGMHCLIAKDIVKLRKCGDGWVKSASNRSSCPCSEDDTCLIPVQIPGLIWVEITYLRPYSSQCWKLARNSFAGVKSPNFEEKGCGGTFVFVGDVLSMALSIRLTAYRPRWLFSFVAYLPNVLEKIFACTFHVSLALALLNSLPVYFLDGESILEVTICYLRVLSPRMKGRVLRLCLLAGTLISTFALLRIFLLTILSTG
ncbi:membrane-bound transcription factor site-2 protease homolog isoform X2 [Rhododendron vialii]|uniref:membrane-bound transcription factor site-2 protease homolog isoform X2 n=1 Tax=Rhododendron vialii TaxID=182163 RepID=UPI00265E09A8|nr:membrane-bound transcription factor site-2 protease homolog isoform X2 [Rhododendron vialii]